MPPTAPIIRARNERLKIWLGLIALIITNGVTLATAVTAHMKKEKEVTARAAYAELSQALSKISDESVEVHEDIANIRGYLAGLESQGVFERQPVVIARRSHHRPAATSSKPKAKSKAKPKAKSKIPKMKAKPKKYKPPKLVNLHRAIKMK